MTTTTTTPHMDVRDKILKHLRGEGRSLRWLSEKIGVNYNTLHSILKQKVVILSEERKAKINKALGTDF